MNSNIHITATIDPAAFRRMLRGVNKSQVCRNGLNSYINGLARDRPNWAIPIVYLVAHAPIKQSRPLKVYALAVATLYDKRPYTEKPYRRLYVELLCSKESGRGHGTEMLRAIEDLATGLRAKKVFLESRKEAVHFYKKAGYKNHGNPNGYGTRFSRRVTTVGGAPFASVMTNKSARNRKAPRVLKMYRMRNRRPSGQPSAG